MIEKKTVVHFIGINGSGISGVACIAKDNGFEVTGCDINECGDYTSQLKHNEIKISIGHSPEHLKDVDIVVLSPALLYKDKYKTIEETKVAMETKITMKWQKFLGEYIMHDKNVIAVSGTHGKTTTTTLVALILEKANFDPTVFVGGVVKEWNTTYRVGKSDYYVCEGDEYDGNFLNYNPKYVILNNLEMEHPERFENFEEYKNNFKDFLKTIQKNGKLVFAYEDKNVLNLILSLSALFKEKNIKLIAYTFDSNTKIYENNIILYNIIKEKNKIIINSQPIEYNLLGEHNTKNIAIASVLALELEIKIETIQNVVKNFSGSKRRMELVLSNEKIKLYDDYAHHHTQVLYTLEAIKNDLKEDEKLIAILEPHLISRIKDNTEEYKKALLITDYPIVTKIYKSRESSLPDIDIVKLLNEDKILFIEDYSEVIKKVQDIISNSSINQKFSIIVMGAGNSYKITTSLKEMILNDIK